MAALRERLAARPQLADALVWLLVLSLGAAVVAVAVATGARVGSAAAPFDGRWRTPRLVPASLLAPAVAAAVLGAVRAGWVDRLPWLPLLVMAWLAAAAWALGLALVDGGAGLARPVEDPREYLAGVDAVHGRPGEFLRTFTVAAPDYPEAVRTHPPGATLVVAVVADIARSLGIDRPAVIGLGVTLVGALAVPLVGLAVRSLCHATAGRRVLPVLALAPAALWTAVSLDAVMASVTAMLVACGVLASERERGNRSALPLAAAAGLLLGGAALLGYSLAWLGISVVAVYFVRRRPLLILLTGASALLPLALTSAAGFDWLAGLAVARSDVAQGLSRERSWLLWSVLDVVLLAVACGPAIIAAARGLRRTPGWPFVAGAGLAVVFALGGGLARGEVERSWLPFFPWLLVPAVAPLVRPRDAGPGAPDATPVPVGLLALGCTGAIALQAVLVSTW